MELKSLGQTLLLPNHPTKLGTCSPRSRDALFRDAHEDISARLLKSRLLEFSQSPPNRFLSFDHFFILLVQDELYLCRVP